MSANVAINAVIDVIRATDNSIVQIAKSARTTELGTTRAAANFTVAPTSTTVNRGDRLRVRVFGDDAGTMASGFTFNCSYNGATGEADGDTFVTFTEDFTFEDDTADPAGTRLFLTGTTSAVDTASLDLEAWTSAGPSLQTAVTNSAAGWTAPIHVTSTAGGTAIDWFTRPLNAFTLGGIAKLVVWAFESDQTANISLRAEVARVANDGTGPTVWGSWCLESFTPASSQPGEIQIASVAVFNAWISGDDLAISNQQRLRIRLYLDDTPESPMASGWTGSVRYAGTTPDANGYTYLILPQTVTEFGTGATSSLLYRRRPTIRNL